MKSTLLVLAALALTACNGHPTQQPARSDAAPAPQSAPVQPLPSQPAPMMASSRPPGSGYNQRDVPADFTLKLLANGKGELSLSSFVGPTASSGVEGVIVAFTASWCPRCKASYPTLEALQQQYGDKLKILLLTQESDDEGKQKLASYLKENNITLPLLDAPKELVETWLGTDQAIPRFYLLDYKGAVMVKDTGFGNKMIHILPNHVAMLMKRREMMERQSTGPL